jgi:ubiquinone biosynthesis protein
LERALVEFPEFEIFDPIGMFAEFKRSLLQELDFVAEQKNLVRFAKNFQGIDIVRVPRPFPKLSSGRVLCMEYFEAVGIRHARAHGFDMEKVGENYLTIAYSMLFKHGFFHGDLHPGNILVFDDCSLGLLDCGMVGFLSEEMKDTLAGLIFSLYRGDHRMVAKLFYDLSIKEERVDFARFEQDAIEVAELHWTGESFQDMDIGSFLMDISFRAMRHKVRAPPSYTMFFKGVMTTEGLAKSLLPEVDPLKAAQPFVEALVRNRWNPEKISEMGTYNLLSYANLMRRLPISLGQLLDDFDHQRFTIHVEQATNKEERNMKLRVSFLNGILGLSSLWIMVGLVLFFVPYSFIYERPIISIVFISLGAIVQLATLLWLFLQKS